MPRHTATTTDTNDWMPWVAIGGAGIAAIVGLLAATVGVESAMMFSQGVPFADPTGAPWD